MQVRDRATIAVLVFDQAPLFETSVPVSVFGVDRTSSGAPSFRLLVVAGEPGLLTTTGGITVHAPYGLEGLQQAGTVIVPSWRSPSKRPPEAALVALRAAHADGATIVGLCLGAFVLAAAGLLDGRRAATHWFYASQLAAAHRTIDVDASVLFVDHGDVLTSAGTAAGLDACLHLVRRTWGATAAQAIARRMVVAPQRLGGQAQYIEQPVPRHGTADEDLSNAMTYALAHLGEKLDVDGLAERAHLSRRSFDRRFRAVMGTWPLQWVQHQRMYHAQHLLETTQMSIDAIARNVGFANAISLRPVFRRILGVSPQAYRQAFQTAVAPLH